MLQLTELARLPRLIGERMVFGHDGATFFITPTGTTTWVIGRDGSGETIAILQQCERGTQAFALTGPGVALEGESWMLLLAGL